MNIQAFLNTVSSELGIELSKQAPSQETESLPSALREFYGQSNGLQLPFLDLWPADQVKSDKLPGFSIFGSDGLFSYCLCATADREEPLGLWDHESGHPPETYLIDFSELLQTAYDAFLRDDSHLQCTIHFKGAAAGTDLTSEVLKAGFDAAEVPFQAQMANPAEAITTVRKLRAKGVDCHLDPVFEA